MSAATSLDDEADDLRPHYDFRQLRWREGRGRDFARYAAAAKEQSLDLNRLTGDVPTSGLGTGTSAHEEDAKVRAFLGRLDREWKPMAAGCTVPVWGASGGRVGMAGCGTLFRVADVSFLVTAAHVRIEAERGGYSLAVCDDTDGAPPVLLRGWVGQDTQLDVAVYELPADVADALPSRQFLTIHQADRRGRRTGPGLYSVFGYPNSRTRLTTDTGRARWHAQSFSYTGVLYDGSADPLSGFDPDAHVLVQFPPAVATLANSTPEPVGPLGGISGCSLWQVYAVGLSATHWTPGVTAVVGVQTHADRDLGYIRGTRWWVVDQIIREGWPHLAPALSLEVPIPHPAAQV